MLLDTWRVFSMGHLTNDPSYEFPISSIAIPRIGRSNDAVVSGDQAVKDEIPSTIDEGWTCSSAANDNYLSFSFLIRSNSPVREQILEVGIDTSSVAVYRVVLSDPIYIMPQEAIKITIPISLERASSMENGHSETILRSTISSPLHLPQTYTELPGSRIVYIPKYPHSKILYSCSFMSGWNSYSTSKPVRGSYAVYRDSTIIGHLDSCQSEHGRDRITVTASDVVEEVTSRVFKIMAKNPSTDNEEGALLFNLTDGAPNDVFINIYEFPA